MSDLERIQPQPHYQPPQYSAPQYQPQPQPTAGWYTDPQDATLNRWWNGSSWTEHSAPRVAPPAQHGMAPVAQYVAVRSQKETGIAYLFFFLLGGFAAHKFYLNQTGEAIGFLALWWIGWLTTPFYFGFVLVFAAGIWLMVDLFGIPGYVRKANARPA
ncbi:DUF2510 domain-containing protein [Diaminobutyricimonas sp. TR449]|uniref:DUF2510 domain-containing protein n=1 Tax=Diaminobutyricimonas sp. TR449 TaxID=2708076 RepID=UPI0014225134|nr:DUF2510 domain-containing protein [Diaminobutyricimonas sp. TR449]